MIWSAKVGYCSIFNDKQQNYQLSLKTKKLQVPFFCIVLEAHFTAHSAQREGSLERLSLVS